jgi:signal transduction histidine kinase
MTALQLLLISLPEAMLVAALGITITGLRPHLGQLFIISIFHSLVSYIIRSSQVPFGLHTIILLLAFIFIIHAVTRLNLITSTLAGLAGLTVFAVVEMLIAPQLLRITGYTYEQALNDPILRIYFFLPEAAAIILIIIFCRRYRINILSYWKKAKQTGGLTMSSDEDMLDEDFYIKQYFPLIALVLSPILLLALLNCTLFLSRTGSISELYLNIFITFISLAVVVLAGLSAAAIKRIGKVVEVECTAKQTAGTISRMEDLIYSIRQQRHDFNHHLQAVYGFLEVGSFREARDYIRNTFSVITTHGELIKTDNHEISAMLYTKIGLAEAKNINLEVLINCGLKDLPLKSGEANSVLGNLIDNAMEAVENTPGEKRLINLEITKPSNEFVFTVVNRGVPIEQEIIDIIFKPNFSTKKDRQGLGLAIVKELVERCNGSVTVSSNNEETIFTVRLPAKK